MYGLRITQPNALIQLSQSGCPAQFYYGLRVGDEMVTSARHRNVP